MSDLSSPDPARPDQQFGAPPSGSLERRLSPRHSTSTKVTFAVSGTEPHWAGIVCDASTTGLLLCCEPHPEVRVGASIGDLGAGMFTALGIVSALHHRNQTGEGIAVDVAMLDSQIALLENAIARYYSTGTSPKPLGARHPSIAPFEAYAVADGHIVIACGNDGLFRQFCRAVGQEQLADDPRFVTNTKRSENVIALKSSMEAFLVAKPRAYWLDFLGKAGIPSAPINDVEQAIHDPQVQHRKVVLPIDDESVAPLAVAGSPIKFSGFATPEKRPRAPDLDEDRARLLAEFP